MFSFGASRHRNGSGAWKGTVLWSATYPFSLPVFILILVEGFRRVGLIVDKPEKDKWII